MDEPTNPPREALLQELQELEMGLIYMSHDFMRDVLAPYDIHPPHYMLLEVLSGRHPRIASPEASPLRMSELAASLGFPANSTTAMIDKLEQLGLVRRSADAHDRRVTRVEITERGHDVVTRVGQEWTHAHRDAYRQFSSAELAPHLDILRRTYAYYAAKRSEAAPSPAEKTRPERQD